MSRLHFFYCCAHLARICPSAVTTCLLSACVSGARTLECRVLRYLMASEDRAECVARADVASHRIILTGAHSRHYVYETSRSEDGALPIPVLSPSDDAAALLARLDNLHTKLVAHMRGAATPHPPSVCAEGCIGDCACGCHTTFLLIWYPAAAAAAHVTPPATHPAAATRHTAELPMRIEAALWHDLATNPVRRRNMMRPHAGPRNVAAAAALVQDATAKIEPAFATTGASLARLRMWMRLSYLFHLRYVRGIARYDSHTSHLYDYGLDHLSHTRAFLLYAQRAYPTPALVPPLVWMQRPRRRIAYLYDALDKITTLPQHMPITHAHHACLTLIRRLRVVSTTAAATSVIFGTRADRETIVGSSGTEGVCPSVREAAAHLRGECAPSRCLSYTSVLTPPPPHQYEPYASSESARLALLRGTAAMIRLHTELPMAVAHISCVGIKNDTQRFVTYVCALAGNHLRRAAFALHSYTTSWQTQSAFEAELAASIEHTDYVVRSARPAPPRDVHPQTALGAVVYARCILNREPKARFEVVCITAAKTLQTQWARGGHHTCHVLYLRRGHYQTRRVKLIYTSGPTGNHAKSFAIPPTTTDGGTMLPRSPCSTAGLRALRSALARPPPPPHTMCDEGVVAMGHVPLDVAALDDTFAHGAHPPPTLYAHTIALVRHAVSSSFRPTTHRVRRDPPSMLALSRASPLEIAAYIYALACYAHNNAAPTSLRCMPGALYDQAIPRTWHELGAVLPHMRGCAARAAMCILIVTELVKDGAASTEYVVVETMGDSITLVRSTIERRVQTPLCVSPIPRVIVSASRMDSWLRCASALYYSMCTCRRQQR